MLDASFGAPEPQPAVAPMQESHDPFAAAASSQQHLAMGGSSPGMGGPPADLAGPGLAGMSDPSSTAPAKTSPLLFVALAIVVVLGVSATIWVIFARPNKPTVAKREAVDAGPPPDALAANPEKPAPETDKPKSAKKDDLLGITASQLAALVDKNHKALSGCYSKALKKKSKLAGTALKVEVTFSAKGKIDTVDIGGPGGDIDGKLDKCLQKSIKKWKFPKHGDKSAYQVKFGLTVEE
jgi:hypothetical protein